MVQSILGDGMAVWPQSYALFPNLVKGGRKPFYGCFTRFMGEPAITLLRGDANLWPE